MSIGETHDCQASLRINTSQGNLWVDSSFKHLELGLGVWVSGESLFLCEALGLIPQRYYKKQKKNPIKVAKHPSKKANASYTRCPQQMAEASY